MKVETVRHRGLTGCFKWGQHSEFVRVNVLNSDVLINFCIRELTVFLMDDTGFEPLTPCMSSPVFDKYLTIN